MASKGYLESLLNALPDGVKNPVMQAVRELATNLAFGLPDPMKKATNFRAIRFDSTTASVANVEFSIHHGQGSLPLFVLPVAYLDSSGGQVVRLKVTRPADVQRVYLSSPDTSAIFSVLVEF